MSESETMEVLVHGFRRAVRRRVEFALQRVAFALDLLLGEMFRGELPVNWREQLAAVLAAEAADGRRVTPESARALEEWIEWWAGRCGLLPGQSNRSKDKQADISIADGLVVSASRGSGGLPAQAVSQELLLGLPQIDWKSLDASPAPPLTYSLPGDPAADPTVLPDSPEAEQMGNSIDMVHFNQRMEERRKQVEAEQQSTAFEILASAAGMLVEPLDYLLTGREIYNAPTNLYSYAGLIPGIPAGAGKILKHADKAAEIAGAAAKAGKAAGKGKKIVDTAQDHHWISMVVHRELERHPLLRGKYKYRDNRFVATAADYEAHHGLQDWHRTLDIEVAAWVRTHRNATTAQFEKWLESRYKQPDLKIRFPGGLK